MSQNKRRTGFTIVEVLVVALVVGMLAGVIFFVLNRGEWSQQYSSTKVELQSELRRALDWISKDVRQAISWDIASIDNTPSSTHIKFRPVAGWDAAADTLAMSADSIEYEYDANTHIIKRRIVDPSGAILKEWVINGIVAAPFFARNSSGTIVALNADDLRTQRKLVVILNGRRIVRGLESVNLALTGEIRIRNE